MGGRRQSGKKGLSKSTPPQPEASRTVGATPDSEDYRFRVDASVVFQLGESLVSDVIQALVELVKNAYDADASWVRVVVDTTTAAPGLPADSTPGYILIEDDGVGMSEAVIRSGWLTISSSPKRLLKQSGLTTDKGRTPLGDKGLGRLGVQRLGDTVTIVTRDSSGGKRDGDEMVVSFSWKDFLTVHDVGDVAVEVTKSEPPTRGKGTSLLITDLRDKESWRSRQARERLQEELSQMLSPYQEVAGFRAVVTVDGNRIDLAAISQKIRDVARVHYRLDFDGQVLHVQGKAKLTFFRPPPGEDLAEFRALVEIDGGRRFGEYLQKRASDRKLTLRCSGGTWFVEYETRSDLKSLTEVIRDDDLVPVNPGPFIAEVDSFDLGPGAIQDVLQQQVFSKAKAFKDFLRSVNGIRVYRDGFGVRVDRDWLGLGRTSTSGASYYGLRPANTIGYVALTAKANGALEEKTDREGFKVTPAYLNFRKLLDEFVKFTDSTQAFLRRAYLDFRQLHQSELANLKPEDTPQSLAGELQAGISQVGAVAPLVGNLSEVLRAISAAAPSVRALEKVSDGHVDSAIVNVTRKWAEVERLTDEATSALAQIKTVLSEVSALDPKSRLLATEVRTFHERLADVYELASLGLTAEALTHEIYNISDQLRGRTKRALDHLKRHHLSDPEFVGFAEHVSSSIDALRKQLGHLEPSLRFVREKRETIPMAAMLRALCDFYKQRFAQSGIRAAVSVGAGGDFAVRMSRGKLTQVMDNLLLNSEYWLATDLKAGHIQDAEVRLLVNSPRVQVQDTGRGVLPDLDQSLFEAFVTGKGRGRGRGLGLFIVRQLLDSEDCTITLLPQHNQHGRRYIFEIDFSGVINESGS